jgi:hypothetical protein
MVDTDMLADLTNVLIIVLGMVSVWYQWRLFKLFRSPAFIMLAVAMAYIVAYRIVLPTWPWMTAYGAALPFYIIVAVNSYWLHRDLSRVLRGIEKPK